jgi:hypothetical protein
MANGGGLTRVAIPEMAIERPRAAGDEICGRMLAL